jgi:hypothetical protein
VTLIAALRCDINGYPGVVVCADSQEVYQDYRVTVNKIEPRNAGAYDLIIGGSGNFGPLIDRLAEAIERDVSSWPAGLDEDSCKERVELVSVAYHASHVSAYQASDEEKDMSFLICARDKSSSQIHLWRLDEVSAKTVSAYDVIGYGESLYKYEANKLYRDGINASQAAMIGLHLLSIGRATTYYIDDPFQVITVHKDGVLVESPHRVAALEQKVRQVDESYDRVLMSAYDVAASPDVLNRALSLFGNQILTLRQQARTVFDSSQIHGSRAVKAEKQTLITDVNSIVKQIFIAAQLNRALYQAGVYGTTGGSDAIRVRQKIASAIHDANEQMIEVIDLTSDLPKQDTDNLMSFALAIKDIGETSITVGNAVRTAYDEKFLDLDQKDRLAHLLHKINRGGKRFVDILQTIPETDTLSDEQRDELRQIFSEEIQVPYLAVQSEVTALADDFAIEMKVAV